MIHIPPPPYRILSTCTYSLSLPPPVNTATCQGRRKKRSQQVHPAVAPPLDGSSDAAEGAVGGAEGELRDARQVSLVLLPGVFNTATVWSTTTSTFTVTTTSYNTDVTISISGYCAYPGLSYNIC